MYEQSNYPGLPGLIYAWADAVERRDLHLSSHPRENRHEGVSCADHAAFRPACV
jgi:hypothetical protein